MYVCNEISSRFFPKHFQYFWIVVPIIFSIYIAYRFSRCMAVRGVVPRSSASKLGALTYEIYFFHGISDVRIISGYPREGLNLDKRPTDVNVTAGTTRRCRRHASADAPSGIPGFRDSGRAPAEWGSSGKLSQSFYVRTESFCHIISVSCVFPPDRSAPRWKFWQTDRTHPPYFHPPDVGVFV